jgi:hypothetical protein
MLGIVLAITVNLRAKKIANRIMRIQDKEGREVE